MKIALITETSRKKRKKQHHFKSHILKKTHQIKTTNQFQISPLDSAQYENISSNNNQQKQQMKTDTRKTLPVYTQEIDPNINPQRTKSKLLKFQINSSERHKRNTSHTSLQNNGLINKIFTTLNHPYPMKIAIIKRKSQENSNPTSNHT